MTREEEAREEFYNDVAEKIFDIWQYNREEQKKVIIECHATKCSFNDGKGCCKLKTISMTHKGHCASFQGKKPSE